MIASIPSATLLGVRGRPVLVEVHVSNGLPGFTVVGLPDAACREARDRVRAALLSSGLPWPLRRVTVNLAPSGVRKTGAGLDLPIAIGCLVATGELDSTAVAGCAFVGELGLDGTIRSVPGALPLTDALTSPAVVVPPACIPEALLVGRPVVRTARSLRELVDALSGRIALARPRRRRHRPAAHRRRRRRETAPAERRPPRTEWRSRPRGCARPADGAPRNRGRGRRRPSPLAVGTSGLGQDDAGRAAPERAASPRRGGAAGDLSDPFGGRPCRCRRRASAGRRSGRLTTGSRRRR